jgi:hypothetical protein
MNGKSPFVIIREYCSKEKTSKLIERILFHKFEEELNELLESYRKDHNGQDPSQDTINGYISTLLSETNLSKNIKLAEEEIREELEDEINKIKKKIGNINFWKSVGASILGSFFFTILLIIIFFIAENQVKSLLHIDNAINTTQQQINSNKK